MKKDRPIVLSQDIPLNPKKPTTLSATIAGRLTAPQIADASPESTPPGSMVMSEEDAALAQAIKDLAKEAASSIERGDERDARSNRRFWWFAGAVGICMVTILIAVGFLYSFIVPLVPSIDGLSATMGQWKDKARAAEERAGEAEKRAQEAEVELQNAIGSLQDLTASVSSLVSSQTTTNYKERAEFAKAAEKSAIRAEAKAVRAKADAFKRRNIPTPPNIKAEAEAVKRKAAKKGVPTMDLL